MLSAGAIYAHTAAKLIFIRLFRGTQHVYSHTVLGWTTWVSLCFASVAVAFVLASAVPIFAYLTGITASLFASWYTYGIAGFFWLYDAYYPSARAVGDTEGEGEEKEGRIAAEEKEGRKEGDVCAMGKK